MGIEYLLTLQNFRGSINDALTPMMEWISMAATTYLILIPVFWYWNRDKGRGLYALVSYYFCMVITPAQASAYIDPSLTTAMISAGVGLVVAISAGITIYWRKAKKKINKVMGKEEVTKDESDNLEDL